MDVSICFKERLLWWDGPGSPVIETRVLVTQRVWVRSIPGWETMLCIVTKKIKKKKNAYCGKYIHPLKRL